MGKYAAGELKPPTTGKYLLVRQIFGSKFEVKDYCDFTNEVSYGYIWLSH